MRVFVQANVANFRAGRWADIETSQQLTDWLALGLVTRAGPHGEPPPDVLPRPLCCGQQ